MDNVNEMLQAFVVEMNFIEAIVSLHFAKIRRDKLYRIENYFTGWKVDNTFVPWLIRLPDSGSQAVPEQVSSYCS